MQTGSERDWIGLCGVGIPSPLLWLRTQSPRGIITFPSSKVPNLCSPSGGFFLAIYNRTFSWVDIMVTFHAVLWTADAVN